MVRGWKPGVIIEFEEHGEVKCVQYDQLNLTEALSAFNVAHPYLGPKNIKDLFYKKGDELVAYKGWQRTVRNIYRDLPFPDYLEVYKSDVPNTLMGDQIYLPCPRCHKDIGLKLDEGDINLWFEYKTPADRLLIICSECGSKIDSGWVMAHLNASFKLFQAVCGDEEKRKLRRALTSFQNTLFRLLVEYGKANPRNQRIILLRYGFLGQSYSQSSIGKMFDISKGRVWQIERKALSRASWDRTWQNSADLTGKLKTLKLERELENLRNSLSQKQAELDVLLAQLEELRKPTTEMTALTPITDLSIDELGLTNRTCNRIKTALLLHSIGSKVRELSQLGAGDLKAARDNFKLGLKVQNLLLLSAKYLMSTWEFGEKSLAEVRTSLASYGLKLRGE